MCSEYALHEVPRCNRETPPVFPSLRPWRGFLACSCLVLTRSMALWRLCFSLGICLGFAAQNPDFPTSVRVNGVTIFRAAEILWLPLLITRTPPRSEQAEPKPSVCESLLRPWRRAPQPIYSHSYSMRLVLA
eukprot:s5874_g3.t1